MNKRNNEFESCHIDSDARGTADESENERADPCESV
jgi:hypothetical protein